MAEKNPQNSTKNSYESPEIFTKIPPVYQNSKDFWGKCWEMGMAVGAFLHLSGGVDFPAAVLSVCGYVVMDVLLAKECGAMEVSKCALFLEGTLS